MLKDNKVLIAKSGEKEIYIYPKMANRHGLIAGATGTGKTTTLRVMAESFSDLGVPVFLADAKGDLAGLGNEGQPGTWVESSVEKLGLDGFKYAKYPVSFWDVYQTSGLPLRTTITEMGPLLLARILGLNDVQSDILSIVFQIADDEEILLIDTKDLKSMLQYVGEHAAEYELSYGHMTKQSLGAMTRAVVALEAQGGNLFFGEPALDIHDWIGVDSNGKGRIEVLDCQNLMQNPRMYGTFMLWLMSELYETLPESGDLDKPRMVFFFDEAHMLFDDASKALLQKVEQVVKLIRSKGVGIYFISQSPQDVPDGILAQLGNKVQHALRAYTPAEQKKAKAAAESFRVNPEFNTFDTLINLGTGEAIISVLGEDGIPIMVEKAKVVPPQSLLGTMDPVERNVRVQNDILYTKYIDFEDRDSAYEFFERQRKIDADEKLAIAEQKQREKEEAAAAKQKAKEEAAAAKQKEKEAKAAERQAEKEAKAAEKAAAKAEREKKKAISSVGSTVAGTVGREIGNTLGGTFGGKLGKKLGGNLGASLGRNLFGTLMK